MTLIDRLDRLDRINLTIDTGEIFNLPSMTVIKSPITSSRNSDRKITAKLFLSDSLDENYNNLKYCRTLIRQGNFEKILTSIWHANFSNWQSSWEGILSPVGIRSNIAHLVNRITNKLQLNEQMLNPEDGELFRKLFRNKEVFDNLNRSDIVFPHLPLKNDRFCFVCRSIDGDGRNIGRSGGDFILEFRCT